MWKLLYDMAVEKKSCLWLELQILFLMLYIGYFLPESAEFSRGNEILEPLGSGRFFDKSNFPALFSNLFCTEKSAGKFNLSKIRIDICSFKFSDQNV